MFSRRKQTQVELIEEVLRYVEASSCFDGLYSTWNTVEEAKTELLSYIERINKSDLSVYEDLHLFFAPTGVLQEFSMDNGWGEEYLKFAEKSDQIF